VTRAGNAHRRHPPCQARRRAAVLACLIALAGLAGLARGATPAPAQPPAAAAQPPLAPMAPMAPLAPLAAMTALTSDEAVALALEHNPTLRGQAAAIDSTRAGEITAALRPNPTFTSGTNDFTSGVSWTIERGGKRRRRIDSTRLATAGAGLDYADARRTLVLNVRSTFTAALLARSNLALARENLESFEQEEGLHRIRHEKGEISGADFLKISLQKLQFETDVQDATLALRTAKTNLRQLLYTPELAADFEVVGELQAVPLERPLDQLQETAYRNRPDLRSAATALAKAEADVRLAQANAHVDPNVALGWNHVGSSFGPSWLQPQFPKGAASNTLTSGFSIPLPVFDRNQGEIARTKAEVIRARSRVDVLRAQVGNDVEVAFHSLRLSRERVRLYEQTYLGQARDSRQIAEFAYRKGATSILDLLEAERTDRGVQLAYRQALADYVTRLKQLEAAVGEDAAAH
jgi:outer membrane protein, heavy metal efflux system